MTKLKGLVTVAIAATIFVVVSAPGFAQGIVKVSGDSAAGENSPGWLFNRDVSTSTPFEFNGVQASIGLGSLYVLPIGANPSDKMIAEYFLLTPIENVSAVSYDFFVGPGGEVPPDEKQFYMNVYANFGESDPLKFYDCRYNLVPNAGSTTGFTTVTFDPTDSYPVTTRTGAAVSPYTCPSSPAEMDTLSPGSTIRVIALNVGDTADGDLGLDGYLDKVVVSTVDGTTTFDFDPTKDICKKDGWVNLMRADGSTFKNQGDCIQYSNTGK